MFFHNRGDVHLSNYKVFDDAGVNGKSIDSLDAGALALLQVEHYKYCSHYLMQLASAFFIKNMERTRILWYNVYQIDKNVAMRSKDDKFKCF